MHKMVVLIKKVGLKNHLAIIPQNAGFRLSTTVFFKSGQCPVD